MNSCQMKKWRFESRQWAIKMGLNTLVNRLIFGPVSRHFSKEQADVAKPSSLGRALHSRMWTNWIWANHRFAREFDLGKMPFESKIKCGRQNWIWKRNSKQNRIWKTQKNLILTIWTQTIIWVTKWNVCKTEFNVDCLTSGWQKSS